MNAKIYTGQNSLENWFIDLRQPNSTMRTFTRQSDPENITVDMRTSKEAAKGVSEIINKSSNPRAGDWEKRGYYAGAALGASVYALTYPVTFVDGPLPIIDIAWAFGMVRFTRASANLGGEIGSWFD